VARTRGHRHRPPSTKSATIPGARRLFLSVSCTQLHTCRRVLQRRRDATFRRICRVYSDFHHLLRLGRSLDRRSVSIDTRIHIRVREYAVRPSRSHPIVRCYAQGIKYESWKCVGGVWKKIRLPARRADPSLNGHLSWMLSFSLSLSLSLSLPRLCHHICPSFDKRHFHVWAGPSQRECRRRHLNATVAKGVGGGTDEGKKKGSRDGQRRGICCKRR